MSAQAVNETIDKLIGAAVPEKDGLETSLVTSLKQTKENPYWTFYDFELNDGDWAGGEFRRGKSEPKALLILRVKDGTVLEADLNLRQRGLVKNMDINPRIPPEGTDTLIYDLNGVQVSYQFTHTSRKLRVVVLEWTPPPAG